MTRHSSTAAGPAELFLSRHGQTVWHAENRYAGTSDVDLTPAGQAQADELARWAPTADLVAVYSSPVRRALETAAPVAAAMGTEPILVDGLAEVHFGIAEGLTIDEIHHREPDVAARFLSDPSEHPFPGAEAPAEAAARGAAALRGIAGDHPGARVLVVAHNTLLRLTLCGLLGIPLKRYRQSLPRLDNGTLTRIGLSADPERPCALRSFNVPLAGYLARTPL